MAKPRSSSSKRQVLLYSFISLGVFLCCLLLLVLLLVNADKLRRLGLTEHIYYLVLLLMGLVASGFVFGVLRSSATYEGKFWGGTLKLGGAIVGVALVVVVGYFFIPKALTFSLTAYVHGPDGPQDLVLQKAGYVVLKLGPDVRKQFIGENGQAYFPSIPANFRDQEVQAWVESDTYESVNPRIKTRLNGNSIDLPVQRKIREYQLGGTVFDESGNPLPDVCVAVPEYGIEKKTSAYGRFDLQVRAGSEKMVDLVAQKEGYETLKLTPTLGDSGVNFSLKRKR